MAQLCVTLKQRFFDANGEPLVGGKLYSYEAGTSTPLATYTDQSGGVENANPVVLDANGEADVWIGNGAYKFVLYDADDNLQWSVDDVTLLGDESVLTAKIADGAVTAAKLATDSVTTIKIQNSAVTTAKIADANVTTAKIADANVTTAKIADANVTTAKIADGNVTQAKRASLGQQVSSSCGTFSTTSTSFVDVTNLSVSITTTGRPVFVAMIPDGSSSAGGINISRSNALTNGNFQILRDSTVIAVQTISYQNNAGTSPNVSYPLNLFTIDTPSAGTYTYKVQANGQAGGSFMNVSYMKLIAFEL